MGNLKRKTRKNKVQMVAQLKTKAEFDQCHADAGDKLVVVDFTATWCPPCQMIAPKFAALAEELGDEVVMCKVDVDENAETAEACGISCMPTFQYYKDGKKVDELQGASEDELRKKVTAHK